MALNDELKNRLFNFKFKQALQYLDGNVSKEDRETIEALAHAFGDCGWLEGHMHTILEALVEALCQKKEG